MWNRDDYPEAATIEIPTAKEWLAGKQAKARVLDEHHYKALAEAVQDAMTEATEKGRDIFSVARDFIDQLGTHPFRENAVEKMARELEQKGFAVEKRPDMPNLLFSVRPKAQ